MPEGRFVLTRIGPTLVVTLEGTADAAILSAAGETIAEAHSRQGAQSVVLEVSGCEVIDLEEFVGNQKLIHTVEWLGLRCLLAGLKPGIVAYLASAGISARSLHTSLDLELALLELDSSHDESEPEPQSESEHEPDVALRPTDVVMLFSDGVAGRFRQDDYPSLGLDPAPEIAFNVVRRFGKSADDASCAVIRCRW